MTDLTALIAELERATEGSGDLDERVALAVGWTREVFQWRDDRREFRGPDLPRFTRSIDAALKLVPAGFAWSAESSQEFPGEAWLYPPNNHADLEFHAAGASAPLAICIAALKAIAALRARTNPASVADGEIVP